MPKRYKLTSVGTVRALGYLQTGEGFVFYTRVWWGYNPSKPATDTLNKALESIPEPWRNNIPDRAIKGLGLLAEGRTSSEALDELVAIEKEVNK
jgi:hypothetical protein